ncbi:glycosyltransferase family 2 protein [Paraburkholderia terricola]|uniref:glycosyltransferase family 2 protein n=1 Tax=Paraburkholderia terricola TaxID=169427 RepID=UPI002865C0C3|nr:glycosyltransferase family 2 protein [Paraburkholderia terricola]MDR6481598.1 GT2 family glycosyltransferase [Paraburkholderia terricola]
MSERQSFLTDGTKCPSVQVQSILYNNSLEAIERSLASMARSAELAIFAKACSKVQVYFGDSSPLPCIDEEKLEDLQKRFAPALEVKYQFFGENAGSARGHNRLAKEVETDFLLIQNPDVVVSPRLLEQLLAHFATPEVGMVEAKQLPIEHPKEYNPVTGETIWATTACAMIPVPLFERLGGFDAASFFLYCDDVDFSWLVRRAGYKVIFQPAAVVFHDKRLSDTGDWLPSAAEHYYSAEAAMILAYKWSREDLAEAICDHFTQHGSDHQKKAAKEFERRRNQNLLPEQLDPHHEIAYFSENLYSKHRYAL